MTGMRMRTLGGTGIKVSPYCLGARRSSSGTSHSRARPWRAPVSVPPPRLSSSSSRPQRCSVRCSWRVSASRRQVHFLARDERSVLNRFVGVAAKAPSAGLSRRHAERHVAFAARPSARAAGREPGARESGCRPDRLLTRRDDRASARPVNRRNLSPTPTGCGRTSHPRGACHERFCAACLVTPMDWPISVRRARLRAWSTMADQVVGQLAGVPKSARPPTHGPAPCPPGSGRGRSARRALLVVATCVNFRLTSPNRQLQVDIRED